MLQSGARRNWRHVVGWLAGAALWGGGAAVAGESPPVSHVVLMVMDDVTVAELAEGDWPNLRAVATAGGIGLLNAQSFSGGFFHRACLTIGCGARATGNELLARAYDAEAAVPEGSVRTVFARRTGLDPGAAQVLHLGLGPAQTVNEEVFAPGVPGALGEALVAAGITPAVLGNSDLSLMPTEETIHREVATILMDAGGRVALGEVGFRLLRPAADFPLGVRADLDAYERALAGLLPKARAIAIDVGDTYRAEAFRALATAQQADLLKGQAVAAADELVGRVLRRLDLSRDMLIVLSPSVPAELRYHQPPVLAAGPGLAGGAWLTSPSTRRPGIVTLMDLSATVVAALGVAPPPSFVGRPLETCRSRGDWHSLQIANEAGAATDEVIRRALLVPVGVWEGVVLFLAGLGLTLPLTVRGWRRDLPPAVLSVVLALPVIFVCKPLSSLLPTQPQLVVLLTLLIVAAVPAVSGRLSRRRFAAAWLGARIALVVMALDTVTGARLGLDSALGYSSYFGGRFYGAGNIVASALLGLALLTCAGWHSRRPPRSSGQWMAVALLLGGVLLVIALPMFGANVGCGIGAVAAFGTYLWVLSGRRVTGRMLLALAVVVVAVISLQIALDLRAGPAGSSHLGRFARAAETEGASPVIDMVLVKAQILRRSFRHAYWTIALLGGVGGWLLFVFRGLPTLQRAYAESAAMQALVAATFLGGLVSMLLNDSGPACPGVLFAFGLGGAFLWLSDRHQQLEAAAAAPAEMAPEGRKPDLEQ